MGNSNNEHQNKIQNQEKEVVQELAKNMRVLLPTFEKFDLIVATYLLREASTMEEGKPDNLTDIYEKIGGKFVDKIMRHSKVDIVWDAIKSLSKKYDTETFDYILTQCLGEDEGRFREQDDLPDSISLLIEKIMGVGEKETVGHFYSGTGLTISQWAEKYKDTRFVGFDSNEKNYLASCMRKISRQNVNYFSTSFIQKINAELKQLGIDRFDLIVSNPPFGKKVRSLSDNFESLVKKRYYLKPGTAAEWLYAGDIMDFLNEGGKAISIMTFGCLLTKQDKEARKYFVENGYIESIIQLPSKLFTITNLPVALVIFSRGNKNVRMIDATDYCKNGRRISEITAENIESIYTMMKKDNEKSTEVPFEKISDNNFVLLPERYLNVKVENVKKGTILSDLGELYRAVAFTADKLDEMTDVNKSTNIRYLRLSDIQEGRIDVSKLNSISLPSDGKKYLYLKKNDIILSRNGNPFKLAIYDGGEEVRVLPVGNMYILRVDTQKINPAYLKIYLESTQGNNQLKKTLTGMTIPIIRMELLKETMIPVPDKIEQQRIEKQYYVLTEEINTLEKKKLEAKENLEHLLDEVIKEEK